MKHYLQVTDDHYRKAVQNSVQQVAENVGSERHDAEAGKSSMLQVAEDAELCGTVPQGAAPCDTVQWAIEDLNL